MSAIRRQAVVVIHGMGEQRPMETLRSFVDGVHQTLIERDADEATAVVRSKPDSIGNIYETVRLSLSRATGGSRPITDFYEFYWAHNMRGTRFSHMSTWLSKVVFTWVGKVPPRLKKMWFTIWGLMLVSAVAAYFLYPGIISKKINPLIPAAIAALIPLIGSSLLSLVQGTVLGSLGDVARYFTPSPDNIGERSSIRRQGIEFLKKLHNIQTQEKVDRIIVIGHSLGSVVAYDLLRLLWTEYNTDYKQLNVVDQPAMQVMDKYANGSLSLDHKNKAQVAAFQQAQFALWEEQQNMGNKWLISDFITMGAAVNAVDYFMVTDQEIGTLKAQRELPACPPIADVKDKSICYDSFPAYTVDGQKMHVKLLNHGALFGVVRWSNIFFTSDFVGGPMDRVFGEGVNNEPVERSSLWFYPGGHTDYWNKKDKNNALGQLVDALKLTP